MVGGRGVQKNIAGNSLCSVGPVHWDESALSHVETPRIVNPAKERDLLLGTMKPREVYDYFVCFGDSLTQRGCMPGGFVASLQDIYQRRLDGKLSISSAGAFLMSLV